MLGNLKVNNSDSFNTSVSLKQGNDYSGIKSGSQDFYSMVLNYNREMNGMNSSENNSAAVTDYQKSFNDNTVQTERKTESSRNNNEEAPIDSSAEKREAAVRADSNDEKSVSKNETGTADKEKKLETHDDDEKEINDFMNSAAGDMLAKKINNLAKGTSGINAEEFLKKFRRLADELLASVKKKVSAGNEFSISMPGEKPGTGVEKSPVSAGFFDKLGRELSKLAAGKKGKDDSPVFTEKEIKEAIGAVIDDIKKGKNRNHERAEIKKAEHDDVKIEKKNEITGDQLTIKKKESGNDSGFDLNSGKDKNGNREGSSLSSGRTDSINRTGLEKNEQLMKSPEFRQSLQEIIDKAKVSVKDSNNATFSVRLFPKDLGSVNVNLLMENGIVSGKFLVDSDEAKNLLMNNLGELKEQLAEAGIQVGEFNVNVNQGGERFASKEKEDENVRTLNSSNSESETAAIKYDYNSSAAHNGHINMVI
ncbi:MAG TPA: flagellar hook-length control protein FliK [Spirochaetota bacterium]|nr:flagellar hook-length control protein FliK [Spirochaetota bacterium]